MSAVGRKARLRTSRPHKTLFNRLTHFLSRKPKARHDERSSVQTDADVVRQRRKRKAKYEPFSNRDGTQTKLVDLELYYTEEQRNSQLVDQLIQRKRELEDRCQEWENQVRHLQGCVAQAETKFRSFKFVYTKERLKCALLIERIRSYHEKLDTTQESYQLLKDEVSCRTQEKNVLEQKLQEASATRFHLERELSASKDVINDLQRQMEVLKQKTKTARVDSETAELKEELRKERKRVLDLSSYLKSCHRALKESIAKQAVLGDTLSEQEKKCAQLRRKIKLDQLEMRRVLSREHGLQAALDIDNTIKTELNNRLANYQKLTKELKEALDANRKRPITSP